MRADTNGEYSLVEGLVAVEIGQLGFGRGCQPQIRAFQVEHVAGEFGQLAVSDKRSGVHDKRWQNFGIAVLARMYIQEETRQRTFQPGAGSAIQREPRSRDLYGGL